MVGITSYGAYIPRYRLSRKTIFTAMGWFNPATAGVAKGEKAVANYDEDSITMSVAAAQDCLAGIERNMVGGFFLSSTTAPFLERQNAAICAKALALRPDIRTADYNACLKAGTTSMLAACDAVNSGSVANFLICAADTRLGKPGSNLEHTLGDGAAAFLIGSENVIAEFKGSYSLCHDFVDFRRTADQPFIKAWEDRWINVEGYAKIFTDAISGLLDKYNLNIADFAKIAIACPDIRTLQGIAKKLKINQDQIQDNLMNEVGNTGTALSLMMLGATLETAKPGDKILVAGYGSGCDVLFFEVTPHINNLPAKMGIQGHLKLKKELDNYAKYQVFRELVPVEVGIRGEDIPLTRMTMIYREGKSIACLCGSKCTVCETPQYPKQRTCINPECKAIDQMEDYYFYNLTGRINSFTADNLAFSWDPPGMYGLIDFDKGGRLYLDFTDCDLNTLKVGLPVKMSFRRKYIDKRRSVYAYFWKAIPCP